MAAVLRPSRGPMPCNRAISMPEIRLSTKVMPTAATTMVITDPNSAEFRARPKLRKKKAPNTSRRGTATRSIRPRYVLAPSTTPIRKAPIASVTPMISPIPANSTASPKKRMVNSSSSLVRISRDTTLAPHRATENITTRKRKAMLSCSTTSQTSVLPLSTTETMAR